MYLPPAKIKHECSLKFKKKSSLELHLDLTINSDPEGCTIKTKMKPF